MGPFLSFLKEAGPVVANVLGALGGARMQEKANIRMSKREHAQNMELMKYQLDYNSPANQMARFRDAGLNENLIYGQGTSGNMESAPKYPNLQAGNYQGALAQVGTQVQQARYLNAQTDLTRVKTDESGAKKELMQMQRNLTASNPYMRKEYVDAMVRQIEATANLKKQEWDWSDTFEQTEGKNGNIEFRKRGMIKMSKELDLLMSKFNLQQADQKIRAEILSSKEFANYINDLQKKWIADGELNRDHLMWFLKSLLSQMMIGARTN